VVEGLLVVASVTTATDPRISPTTVVADICYFSVDRVLLMSGTYWGPRSVLSTADCGLNTRADGLFVVALEGSGVDTIALVGRAGTIVEHVSKVRIAFGAQDFGPPHE
jgi:hypothetical protein